MPATDTCSRPGATPGSLLGVQQIVRYYADRAGVSATPHTFRHQAISWLTKHSGLGDAELQLITGHARRETLAIYQHVALDGELEQCYQRGNEESGPVNVSDA
jgi:integrase